MQGNHAELFRNQMILSEVIKIIQDNAARKDDKTKSLTQHLTELNQQIDLLVVAIGHSDIIQALIAERTLLRHNLTNKKFLPLRGIA